MYCLHLQYYLLPEAISAIRTIPVIRHSTQGEGSDNFRRVPYPGKDCNKTVFMKPTSSHEHQLVYRRPHLSVIFIAPEKHIPCYLTQVSLSKTVITFVSMKPTSIPHEL